MTTEDIIRMAREAGFSSAVGKHIGLDDDLERFAALVAAAERNRMISDGWRQCAQGQKTTQHCGMVEQEREACARVCDISDLIFDWEIPGGAEGRQLCNDIAAAIRARGQQQESDDANPSF